MDRHYRFTGRFEPVARFKTAPAGTAWWFVCDGTRLWVRREADGSLGVPQASRPMLLGLAADPVPHPLGYLDGVPCYGLGADSAAETADPQGQWLDLRRLHGRLPADLYLLAGRAVQIVAWDRTHRYCGQCATPLVFAETDRAKQCPACGLRQFPRLAPAVMAMVVRGPEVLLARGPEFPEGVYSILAGFVEPGETLEGCVRALSRLKGPGPTLGRVDINFPSPTRLRPPPRALPAGRRPCYGHRTGRSCLRGRRG